MKRVMLFLGMIALCGGVVSVLQADQYWSQFRGPNASGHAGIQPTVPDEFGPEKNLLWKRPLAKGISSPCIHGQHVYVTTYDSENKQLAVVCMDRKDGTVLWQSALAAEKIEKVHKISSPANATTVANDQYVYAYFASCGLYCFNHQGQQIWEYPLAVSKRFNGSGTSPIIVDEQVILNREDDREKYLVALDVATGKEIWKTQHGGRGGSFGEATPVIWEEQVILHRQGHVAAFAIADGKLLWSVSLQTVAASTPVIDNDVLYVSAWNNFGEPELRGHLPEFSQLLKKNDKDKDGQLSRKEMPWGPTLARRPEVDGRGLGSNSSVKFMFQSFDSNGDGKVGQVEWDAAADLSMNIIKRSSHGLTAIKLPAGSDMANPETLWSYGKSVPEVPSPLVIGDYVYMIKNGGILTCLEKATGKMKYRRRIKATGPYCSSLIAVNDHIIAASGDGVVTVLKTGGVFEIVSSNDFGESILSTPAIDDGVLFVRTDRALYALREQE